MTKFTDKISFVDKQGKINQFVAITERTKEKDKEINRVASFNPEDKTIK